MYPHKLLYAQPTLVAPRQLRGGCVHAGQCGYGAKACHKNRCVCRDGFIFLPSKGCSKGKYFDQDSSNQGLNG